MYTIAGKNSTFPAARALAAAFRLSGFFYAHV
jgi:hypothetical protein